MAQRICSIDGCSSAVHARDYCSSHYGYRRRYGDPLFKLPRLTGVPCSVVGCAKPAKGRGWCAAHWARWKRHGDPEGLHERIEKCTVEGCEAEADRPFLGLCETHYMRLRRTGTTELAIAPEREGQCTACGDQFTYRSFVERIYCSSACKGRHDAKNYSRRQRQAKVREPISVAHLAERDSWRCHLCQGKVTQSNWSVDHLIPLSAGGDHTYANVALAHVNCNKRRGVRGTVQLRLIG